MRIIETPIFTKRVLDILSEEEYRQFQIKLVSDPSIGKISKEVEEFGKSGGPDLVEEKEEDLAFYTIGTMKKDYY